MGIIHIEDVDDAVMKALALRAERKGRSLEDEVRAVLEEVASYSRADESFLEEAERIRAMTPNNVRQVDSTEIVRQIRDSRHAGG